MPHHFLSEVMRKFTLSILVTLLWPVMAHATVIEFNGDGTVTTYEARDYLAEDRRHRIHRAVVFTPSSIQLPDAFDEFIHASSERHGVSFSLIKAVIYYESSYVQNIVCIKGAQGLMQVIPATAKRFGVADSFNPEQNIEGGTKYLKFLLKKYDGDRRLALAAYNAGEGVVDKYGGIPPYRETINYVEKIEALLDGGRGL